MTYAAAIAHAASIVATRYGESRVGEYLADALQGAVMAGPDAWVFADGSRLELTDGLVPAALCPSETPPPERPTRAQLRQLADEAARDMYGCPACWGSGGEVVTREDGGQELAACEACQGSGKRQGDAQVVTPGPVEF